MDDFDLIDGLTPPDRRALEQWCARNGIHTVPPPDPSRVARQEIEFLEGVIERKEATKKHAPDKRAREKIDAALEKHHQRLAALEREAGIGQPYVGSSFGAADDDPPPPKTCTYCRDVITRREAYVYGRTCPTCIAKSEGGNV
jgi:hypothetical protein